MFAMGQKLCTSHPYTSVLKYMFFRDNIKMYKVVANFSKFF